jgi:hypothetical protein
MIAQSQIFRNVLSKEEIQLILDFYTDKHDAKTEQWVINKNLEYHIPEDFSYQLLNSKLTAILGEHEFATGAYKECLRPYPLHVDAYDAHAELGTVEQFATVKKHNRAMLIPLVEGHPFKTVTFKCYAKKNDFRPAPADWLVDTNELNPDEYTHCKFDIDLIKHLPVDTEYSWQLGDILTWDRDQLHISADFAKHGLIKKFLIMFIA